MAKYKNNHTVPSGLLRQWETYADERHGVYQYDMGSKKINFASSRKKSPFSFASENYFYVPMIENKREFAVEKWLGDMENLLPIVVKKLNNGTEGILVNTRADAHKLLMGMFSLRHRTVSAINGIRKYLEDHPEIRAQMNVSNDRDINLVLLENMVNATTEDATEYANCKVTVFRNHAGELIIGDQPFLGDVMNNGIHFVVLSPNFFISIEKSPENAFFTYMDVAPEFLSTMNKYIAAHARKWIIAKDKAILEKNIPHADEPKQDDTPIMQIPKYLISGARIVQ